MNFEKACQIVRESDIFVIRQRKLKTQDYCFIFTYILNDYSQFNEYNIEFRGCCYFPKFDLWVPSIHKFFNYGETEFAKKHLSNNILVLEKIDGTLITAFVLNDKVVLKTKNSFDNKYLNAAYSTLTDNYIRFIKDLWTQGYVPHFELITDNPMLQTVLLYNKTQLILIQIRNMNSTNLFKLGDYLDYNQLQELARLYDIPYAKQYNISVDDILYNCKIRQNFEGYVTIDNLDCNPLTRFRKFKTEWYFKQHKLLEGLSRPDIVINLTLNEQIDDVLPLVNNPIQKQYIINIQKTIIKYFTALFKRYADYLQDKAEMTRKDFALKYKDLEYFDALISANNESELKQNLIKGILKQTNKLKKAEGFLKRIKEDIDVY